MRRSYLSFLFLIIAVSMTVNNFGQSAAKLPPVKMKEYTLRNGLRVILQPDDSTPVVAVIQIGRQKMSIPYKTYRGEDCMEKFYESLFAEWNRIIDRIV